MRTISANSLAKVLQNQGTEPIIIIEVQWVENGPIDSYADRNIINGGNVKGKILNAGEIDAVIQISEGAGQTQAISVTLDDTDGTIKDIIDNNDIHKRPAFVYQYYDGLLVSEKFLLFSGEINTPIVWNEGDRTISFDILSKLEDKEVGFSPEEGEFINIPKNLIGKPWPSCFGTVIDLRAVQIEEAVTGTLAQGIGIHDFTIINQLLALGLQANFLQFMALIWGVSGGVAAFNGDEAGEESAAAKSASFAQQGGSILAQIAELQQALSAQVLSENSTNSAIILDGNKFPQGQSISLNIGGAIFGGSFNGDVFSISSKRHPERDAFDSGEKKLPTLVGSISAQIVSGGDALFIPGDRIEGESAGFFWAEAGSDVRIAGQEPIDFVVSIVPGTVLKVSAFRSFEGTQRLVTVPTSNYSVSTQNFGSINAVIVTLNTLLSNLEGELWDDDIYVTFKSDVGPNTVDILEFLISTYTDIPTDTTSFTDVKTKLTAYPSNFAIVDRKNIITILQEIAFQARCALWIANNTFFIKYLSEEPTPTVTINENDIILNTLEVSHTETEELVTELIGEWRESYAVDELNKIILRHNVKKYGILDRTIEFYIYNNLDLVRKSATFWIIRWANTWKKLKFTTPLNKLELETFDSVTLDFNTPYIANVDVIGFIENAKYDSNDKGIQFEVWTPVKSGTMEPYIFAWPANVSEQLIFPTIEERTGGFAGGDGIGKLAVGRISIQQFGVSVGPDIIDTSGIRIEDYSL